MGRLPILRVERRVSWAILPILRTQRPPTPGRIFPFQPIAPNALVRAIALGKSAETASADRPAKRVAGQGLMAQCRGCGA